MDNVDNFVYNFIFTHFYRVFAVDNFLDNFTSLFITFFAPRYFVHVVYSAKNKAQTAFVALGEKK